VAKAIALLSGGLDSQLAVKLMLEQGMEVEALTSGSVFHHHGADEGENHPAARAAGGLGVPITLLETSEEMLQLVKNPRHGHGRRMNPCIDCRVFLLGKAAQRMREVGADFIVTGEVVGQRPMSQRREAMAQIDREAGVEGLVLRPLCARQLEPTAPEREGLVDRERLRAIRGRSRKEQIALARELGITDYPSPAGGCLLTDPGFAHRLAELLEHGDPGLNEVALLKVGRHFRLGPATKLIMGRNEAENGDIEVLARPTDLLMDAADFMGPTSLLRGDASDANLATAAALTLQYGKAKNEAVARVVVRRPDGGEPSEIEAAPAAGEAAAAALIAR